MVRASDCQCTSNGPGFDTSIRRHSGFWGTVLNIVRVTVKSRRKIWTLDEKVLHRRGPLFFLESGLILMLIIRHIRKKSPKRKENEPVPVIYSHLLCRARVRGLPRRWLEGRPVGSDPRLRPGSPGRAGTRRKSVKKLYFHQCCESGSRISRNDKEKKNCEHCFQVLDVLF